MTREAKLYYLNLQDWKPLIDQIEQHRNYALKYQIVIIKEGSEYPPIHNYTILSLHDDVDKLIEDYGAKEAGPNDVNREDLHKRLIKVMYGDESKLIHLRKP